MVYFDKRKVIELGVDSVKMGKQDWKDTQVSVPARTEGNKTVALNEEESEKFESRL